jgi:hypothetical protein
VEPDVKQTMNFFEQWQEVPDTQVYDNGFKIQWEPSSATSPRRALPLDAARRRQGRAAGRGGAASWKERRWVDVPALSL